MSPKGNTNIDYNIDGKTIEQVNLRQMSSKFNKIENSGGQRTNRRMDTSGFDHNLGSEIGNSPLAKRMVSQQNPVGVMKNLKNAKYTCEQIPEVDKSEQYTIDENDDLCYELM